MWLCCGRKGKQATCVHVVMIYCPSTWNLQNLPHLTVGNALLKRRVANKVASLRQDKNVKWKSNIQKLSPILDNFLGSWRLTKQLSNARRGKTLCHIGERVTHLEMSQTLYWFHIKKKRSSPYEPHANGIVESFNRTLKATLFHHHGGEWDHEMPAVILSFTSYLPVTPHSNTGS